MARKKTQNKSRYLTAYAFGKLHSTMQNITYHIKHGNLQVEEKPLYIEQDGAMVQYDVVKVIDSASVELPAKNPNK